jgi:hypothetical protein
MAISELLPNKIVMEEFQGYNQPVFSTVKLFVIIKQRLSKMENE